MSDGPTLDNLDVADFTVGAMLRTGLAVRQVVRGAASLEQAADMIVRYLHGSCIDPATRQRTLALVRFYKTHSFGGLEPELQRFVAAQLGDIPISDDMRCLALLATIGDEPAWNSRHESRSHKAIALPSAEIVRAAPMIARLLEEMGLDIE